MTTLNGLLNKWDIRFDASYNCHCVEDNVVQANNFEDVYRIVKENNIII